MAKKSTRKELRKPDEFIAFSQRAIHWVHDHLQAVVVTGIVACVAIAATWYWSDVQERNDEQATAMLGRGLTIYRQTIIASTETLPPAADGIPRFKTRKAKLEAAERAFTEVIAANKAAGAVTNAYVLRAAVHYDLGLYADKHYKLAAADYEKALARIESNSIAGEYLRRSALEGLMYSFEAQKAWSEALSAAAKFSKEVASTVGTYHEARILLAKGDKDGALARFRKVVRNTKPGLQGGDQYWADLASKQLLLLEEG